MDNEIEAMSRGKFSINIIETAKPPALNVTSSKRNLGDCMEKWQHQNTILYNDGATIHKYEMKALGTEMREEMRLGLNGLHQEYAHLLNGT